MVTAQEIEHQLKAIGVKFTWWGRGAARELEKIIEPGEVIKFCINGRYEGGFAMLCITDCRAVLIDKKPLSLSLEYIRYDMISDVSFDGRLVDSTIVIFSLSKQLRFTSFRGDQLRLASAYIQRRVLEIQRQLSADNSAQDSSNASLVQSPVHSYEFKITNPYTKIPLMMRRRISRFYS